MPSVEERMVAVEEKKLELERQKLAFEKSWRKILGAGLLAALVALAVGGIGFWQNRMAESRQAAQADVAQKQQDGLWGVQVLELYVTHPDQFDPAKSPDTAAQNMAALCAAAPDLMRPILEQRKDALIREGLGLPGVAAGVKAIQEALAGLEQGVKSVGDAAAAHEAGVPLDVDPAAYSIYIQYGNTARGFASRFGSELADLGFRVPGLEPVSQAPDVPEVRYYRQDQKLLAEWLAMRLVDQAPRRSPAISKLVGNGGLPGGIIEVWIPQDWG